MNSKVSWSLALVTLLLTGCAAWWYPTTPVFPDSSPMPLPPPRSMPTEPELLQHAASQPLAPLDGKGWQNLFDGNSLAGWRITDFGQGGRVTVTNGLLLFERGEPFVGVNGTNAMPTQNYEIALDAMRIAGNDFFCGLTFPVGETHCSLIVGGWGGGVVGLSNVDGADASENETSQYISFESGRWYRIRLKVTEDRIEAWIEQKQVVDLVITGRKLELRFGEILRSRPFGISSWETTAAFRAIKFRTLHPDSG